MSVKHKFSIKKSVLQVKYKPNVSFYDQMYSHSELFSDYPHWETDRLKLVLKNFDKKQSIVIKHDSIGFETDEHKESKLVDFSSIANQYLTDSRSNENIFRLGYRSWALCEVDMNFEELKDILNLKLLNGDFLNFDDNHPSDISLTIIGHHNDLSYRLFVGPMKKSEVQNFIRYNIDSHINPNSINKYSEIASIHNSYPEVSLYMDIDIYKNITTADKINDNEVILFQKESQNTLNKTSRNLLNHIFSLKI